MVWVWVSVLGLGLGCFFGGSGQKLIDCNYQEPEGLHDSAKSSARDVTRASAAST